MRWLPPAAAALLVLPAVLAAYQNGPIPGVTGGFGEPTCAQCHVGKPPADGSLSLDVPEVYRAGAVYKVRVTLRRTNMSIGGFEIAARFAAGERRGTQAGALKPLDEKTQVVTGNDVQYAQHTEAGSRAARPGTLEWFVEWRAPDLAGGEVVFHAAGNASNGDFSQLGDTIYTSQSRSRAQETPASAAARSPYSARSATTGSTFEARRAGR